MFKKLSIAMPLVQGLPAEVVESLLNGVLEARKEFEGEVEIHTCVDLFPYDRARNFLFGESLESGCDLIWCLDSDCLVPKGAFTKLYATLTSRSAQAVLAHNYMRGYPYVSSWFSPLGDTFVHSSAGSGVHKIRSGAFHCVLIDLKWVKENMKEPYFKYTPHKDEEYRVMEDAWFFKKMGESSGLVLGDADVRTGHVYTRIVVSDKTIGVLRKLQLTALEEVDL